MHTNLLAARRAARAERSRILSDCRWVFPAESFLDFPELHGYEFDSNSGAIDLERYEAIVTERLKSGRLH